MSINKLKCKLCQNGTQSTILKIERDNCPISRSGIVQLTGLPHAATSRAVGSLLENGTLTEEPFADTQGPRRKRGISFNSKKGYCIAVEYSANSIEAVVLDTAYNKILEKQITTRLKEPNQKKRYLR